MHPVYHSLRARRSLKGNPELRRVHRPELWTRDTTLDLADFFIDTYDG